MLAPLIFLSCTRDPRLPLDRPLPCGPRCDAAQVAVDRAIGWIDTATDDPELSLNLDVLIATANIARTFRSTQLDALVAELRTRHDRPGEPRRRLYAPEARLAENPSTAWTPVPGMHPNPVLVEVLYCAEWGLRPVTVDWICTELRDDGGRSSAHAAWFLSIAVDGDCVDRAATCLDAVAGELRAGAAVERPLDTAVERDLLGEQILFGLLAGVEPDAYASAVDRLIATQQPDGGFGSVDRVPSDRVGAHATFVAAWALTEWVRRQQPSVSEVRPKAPEAPSPPPGAPPVPSAKPTPETVDAEPFRQTIPSDAPPPPPAP